MRRLFRWLFPRSDTHLFLARSLTDEPAPFLSDVPLHRVASAGDSGHPALAAFCDKIGFGADWPGEMLAQHAAATLALETRGGAPMAMAWATVHPFHVEEIHATFDPGGANDTGANPHAGVYLFGDFVAPDYRGKKLQRLLVNARLRHAREHRPGLRLAYTLIHTANTASLKSYQAEQFGVIHALHQTTIRGQTKSHLTHSHAAKKNAVRGALKLSGNVIAPEPNA